MTTNGTDRPSAPTRTRGGSLSSAYSWAAFWIGSGFAVGMWQLGEAIGRVIAS